MRGNVILVGAGPGDPGLLTVKGRAAIENAEVVVYDRLVGPRILALIPPEAEKVNAGKASSNHLIPQEKINRILLDRARAGKRVVRLKGGDPFLFGRGGEELELLIEHGVPFEVVPGVTSAIAAPSYAGIPVTHRDFCSSVHIITGHARENRPPNINFEALAGTGGTLVFLMGVTALSYICDGLLAAGMPGDMPAAIVERGTLPAQRRLTATIETLVSAAAEKDIRSPAIIVVGKVCTLSDDFCWVEKKPLFGRKIVVTRPKERIGTLSDALRGLGAEVYEYPCIATEDITSNGALDAAVDRAADYEWLALTSPAGVNTVIRRILERGLDVRALSGVKLAAIGSATAAELQKFGLRADYVPEEYSAEALGKGLADIAAGRVLILRAREGSPYLTEALDAAGIAYDDIPVYQTVFTAENAQEIRELLAAGEIDAVTFTSASTVKGFVGSIGSADLSAVMGACIGRQTAAEAEKHGIRTFVAERAAIPALCDAIERYLTEEQSWS